jgi:hypothetical protein
MNNKLRFALLSISCLVFLSCCYINYEIKGYISEEDKFDWGIVGAKL